MSSAGYAGITPLTWHEIRSYSSGRLTEWECLMLRKMSEQYCTYQRFGSENRAAKAPWQPELSEEEILERAKRMERML